MGSAWASALSYPWEHGLYVGGIETVKVNLTLRIYSNAWHVYAGLAILNPQAREQIHQYAKSATELFKLMLAAGAGNNRDNNNAESEKKLRERVEWARSVVFGNTKDGKGAQRRAILLSEGILDQFSLGKRPENVEDVRTNSHLSLLAMVDCWAHFNINPFRLLDLAATPLYRLFLGVAEYLFHSPTLLSSAIHSAIYETWHRSDDLEFVHAARGWSQCIQYGSFEVYRKRFDETRVFFESRFEEAGLMGSRMIKTVMESELQREADERT
jgi:prephenate dehydrogenase (NADP+)